MATVDLRRRVFELDTGTLALDPQPLAPAALAAWLDRAYVSLAAEMVGTARRIFTMTLPTRRNASSSTSRSAPSRRSSTSSPTCRSLERATAAVHYAAMSVDAADPRAKACHVAKASAGEAARRILKDGIQIHGGIGYTWEHDLHLFLRRATADEFLLGPTGWHLDRLAELLIGD